MTTKEVEGFKDALLDLSTKVVASVDELAELSIIAARAGIHTKDAMIQIATAASMLAELSDLTAPQATNALIKIIKAMGLATSEAHKVSSAIVGIAKNVAATEGEVISAVQRMAGVGRILGMTIPELTAIAGVTIQMGVRATRAGTLWTRAFLQIEKNSKKAATAIGITDDQFRKLVSQDSFNALTLLLIKIGELADKTEQLKVLRAIFQGRGVKVAAPALKELDFLLEQVTLANKLFKEGTLIANDYAMVMDSTKITLKLLSQAFGILGITFGEQIIPSITLFAKVLKERILGKKEDIAAFGLKIGEMVEKFTLLIFATDILKNLAAIFKITGTAIKDATARFRDLQPDIQLMILGIALLNTQLGAAITLFAIFHDTIRLAKPTVGALHYLINDKLVVGLKKLVNTALFKRLPGWEQSAILNMISDLQEGLPKIGDATEKAIEETELIIARVQEILTKSLIIPENAKKQLQAELEDIKKFIEEIFGKPGKVLEDGKILGFPSLESIGNFFTEFKSIIDNKLENMKVGMAAFAQLVYKIFKQTFDAITSSFGTAMVSIIMEGKKAGTAFKDMWKSVASIFINLIAQMIAKMVILLAMMAIGGLIGGPGGAAAGWKIGRVLLGMQKGGLVPGRGTGDRIPTLLEPGELVIPKKDVSRVINNSYSPNVTVSMAGALVMDDPIAVQKLYREYLRDTIRDDIEGGRDTFYG